MASSLYLCYFGLRQPLVQTQVIPYLLEIAKDGVGVSLLTFEPNFHEKWTAGQIGAEKENLAKTGIEWHCLPYHKRFSALATVYDVLRGTLYAGKLLRNQKFDVLHVRAHIPGPMALLARRLARSKPKILFDIRGFVPEEYTDAGIWPKDGWLYRSVKRTERWLMREADGFVVLTERAREILFPESKRTGVDRLGRPVEVIPCCVDFEHRFRQNRAELRSTTRKRLELDGRRVITHLGALGGLYLTEALADFLASAREQEPSTFAMFLTQSEPDLIIPLLESRGFTASDYFVQKISTAEVPKYLCAADIALSFVRAGYATQSRSPTKIPEYLACGLPIVSNSGVGDVDKLIRENGIGVLVENFSREANLRALEEIDALGDVRDKCRETALREFDLEKVGGTKYRRLYRKLLSS